MCTLDREGEGKIIIIKENWDLLGKINFELLTLFALHIKIHSHHPHTHTHTPWHKKKLNPLSLLSIWQNPLQHFQTQLWTFIFKEQGRQTEERKTFKDDTLDKTHKTELFNYELLLIKPKESKDPKIKKKNERKTKKKQTQLEQHKQQQQQRNKSNNQKKSYKFKIIL